MNRVVPDQLGASRTLAVEHKIMELDDREDPINRRCDSGDRCIASLDVLT